MQWVWCVLLASASLPSPMQSAFENSSIGYLLNLQKLSPCSSASDHLVSPKSLGPVDDNDRKKVSGDCKGVPLRWDNNLWHQVKEGLWFQAVGFLELEDDKYTPLSNRLECDPDSLNCAVTVSSVLSFTASKTWGWSSSSSVGLKVGLKEALSLDASVTTGSSYSYSASTTTSSETSYTCSVPGNRTVYLAARVQYYLIFGWVSEWTMFREFVVIDGKIYEKHRWGWERTCQPMFRIPKVQADRSVAGTRRCVVESLPSCGNDILYNVIQTFE